MAVAMVDHAVAGLHGRGRRPRPASDRSASATACTTWRGAPGCSAGPALGGFVFERIGFARLTLLWAPMLLVVDRPAQRGNPLGCSIARQCTLSTTCHRHWRNFMKRTRIALALSAVLVALLRVRASRRRPRRREIARRVRRHARPHGQHVRRQGARVKASRSTVAVKGDRKATMGDTTGQIIDLAEEKIYDLDLKKKSYKVTTFAELRRRMEEAQQEGRGGRAQGSRRSEKEKPAKPPIRTRSRWRSTSTSRTPARRRRSTASTRTRRS